MFDLAMQAIETIFSWPTFGWLVFGVVTGLAIGAVPGVGGPTMLSVVVPFTFVLSREVAFALMIGYMAVGVMSDSIPAILMGVPGSASSQATILDGYAMTRKGLAARALGGSFTGSILGGLLGALLMTLSMPVIRPVVLAFGAPEFLLLGLWGVSMVAVLSGNVPLKGVIAGGLGLLLGAIGADPFQGFARWTFGTPYLWEGISLATLGLGFFGIPELVSYTVRRTSISEVPPVTDMARGQLAGAREAFRHWRDVLRGTGIGALIGAIPGIGAAVVDWLIYGLTVQSSKDKSSFGKGNIRSVIAVDAGTSSCIGGSLIPTLSFGVPGSGQMAFLLAVLLAHGVRPGPSMLTTDASIWMFFVWGLALAILIGGLICFLGANQIAKLTRVDYYYLFAMIIPIMFLAAYNTRNSLTDMFVFLLLGVIGYIMRQVGWPRPPLLLGFVLSRVLESNLTISTQVYGWSWVQRPLVLILFVVITLGLAGTYRWHKRTRESMTASSGAGRGSDGTAEANGQDEAAVTKRSLLTALVSPTVLWTLFVIVFLGVGLFVAQSWPSGARRFPMLIGSATMVLLLIQLLYDIRDAREGRGRGETGADLAADTSDVRGVVLRRSLEGFTWLAGLFAGAVLLGLSVALPLFTTLYLRVAGRLPWIRSLAWGAVMVLFSWGFGTLASVYWNPGILLSWLR